MRILVERHVRIGNPDFSEQVQYSLSRFRTRHVFVQQNGLGHLIADVLDKHEDADTLARVRTGVAALTRKFPVYG